MVRKWDPFRDLISLHDQMTRFVEMDAGRTRSSGGLAGWHPPADVSEDQTAIYLRIEIPGMNEESLDLAVEDRVLTLRGERHRPQHQGTHYLQSEILSGPFHRRFLLPVEVDAEQIAALYKNGILEIVIPKKPAVAHRLEIDRQG